MGLYYEEFEVGRRFVHAVHRTVTETDNVLISTLTMNPAAVHLDAEACKSRSSARREYIHAGAHLCALCGSTEVG